jgi:uncharacterized protein YbcC (UPF0753/DUF2309 family)
MSVQRSVPRLLLVLSAGALALLVLAATGHVVRWDLDPLPLTGDTEPLRALLLAYVSVLGAVVLTYAATNLRGQSRQGRFALVALATVAGLAVMVTASSLAAAALGWTLSGLGLVALVDHRHDAAARRASGLVLRRLLVGDAAIWAAVVVDALGGATEAVAVLLVLAAVVRSALVPAHRWLPETAEAPSPVSALLHAGVVNGGPMVCLLFWPVLVANPAALVLLLLAGAASVVVGTASARMRADVKGRLAGSTTAQLGLVAVQLGLGLPAVALLHVLAHGCWKAWSFLRAGGAPARVSPAAAGAGRVRSVRPALVAALAGAAVALAAGVAVGRQLDVSGHLVFSATLLAVLVGVGVVEAARLERTRAAQRLVLGAAVVALAVGYLAAAGWVDTVTGGWFGSHAAAVGPVQLVAALAVAGVGSAAVRLRPESTGGVANLVAASLLPPGTRGRRTVAPAPSEPVSDLGGLPVEHLGLAVELAAVSVGPAWPLRSLVASNPLAPMEKLGVEDAAGVVRKLHGRDPRPRLSSFLAWHEQGLITDAALRRALGERDQRAPGTDPLDGVGVDDLVTYSRALASRGTDTEPLRVRICDLDGPEAARRLDLQAADWTARAWGTPQGAGPDALDPWTLWRTAASHPTADLAWGARGLRALAVTLPEDPAAALAVLWPRVEQLTGHQDFYTYAASQLATGRGWASRARWRARRDGTVAPILQLLALRTALDVVLADGTRRRPVPVAEDSDLVTALQIVSVWQRALDLSVRRDLLAGLAAPTTRSDAPTDVRVESVWCIDTRSERIRRALEGVPGHRTHGYAGFFGAALRHHTVAGRTLDLVPGLARPAWDACEVAAPLGWRAAAHALATRIGQSPAAVFAWAETSGLPALAATLTATASPVRWRALTRLLTGGAAGGATPAPAVDAPLPTTVAADVAEAVLRATGLATSPADVVLLVGHGSSTENNAFASAYDCGACGGHPGSVNATVVAAALNDPAVRAELARRGMPLPEGLTFAAALHDTTTDRVTVFEPAGPDLPADGRAPVLERVREDLARAGQVAAAERSALLADGRRDPVARAADWSEPMPEWGLAGNSALVVGPRSLTRDLDLGGSAFLHDYEPGADPEGAVLEQVLIGPALVTQWISAQYYAAASAPELFGAGDKTTHNVVGDVGVLTGAHGDLRSGLPWQAVAAADPVARAGEPGGLRHLPARHLVIVHADPTRLLELVTRHEPLHRVVGNGWMQLVAQPPGTRELLELTRDLEWQECAIPAGRATRTAREDWSGRV